MVLHIPLIGVTLPGILFFVDAVVAFPGISIGEEEADDDSMELLYPFFSITSYVKINENMSLIH